MKILFALFAGTLCQTVVESTKSNPIVLTGTCLTFSQGQCRKLAAWHVYKGASLVDKIKKTENIDRFETDVVDALDASNLHRYFRQDQTKILFGDVVDGKLVLGREVSNVYSKSLNTITDVIRMESVNSKEADFDEPAVDRYEPEPTEAYAPIPPTKKPETTTTTKKQVISIEPEYSDSSDSNKSEDQTESPPINFLPVEETEAEPDENIFEPQVIEPELEPVECTYEFGNEEELCSCALPFEPLQTIYLEAFGVGCENMSKEKVIDCREACAHLFEEASGDEESSGDRVDDDEDYDDEDYEDYSSERASNPSGYSLEYEEDPYRSSAPSARS
ncbi:Oidioi.mRNA.OKI2018_I69.chr2.g4449.t1.cds [Oikopleura dioica]|uniref:Oidioi.mRNA.OKI2018_I69.chr2.g4449.t1.cds n=1 Tax=Oikopleura dioica TaxID=34765 RepID=A0ABN7SXF4_OIKDI|nr:Oidioi.mRNA.OKI2018_I69.chr2.g4449.t1.cds [Oikopleura dioica]